MRRTVPLVIAFSVGVILLFQYFAPGLYDLYETALVWSPVIVGVTAFLGIISFCQHHWRKSKKRAKDWGFSILALTAFAAMVLAALWGELFGFVPPEDPPVWGEGDKANWVSFEDVPDDAGGVLRLRWQLTDRVGDIRGFDVFRRGAEEPADSYVKIAEVKGNDQLIGRPRANREIHGRNLASVLENGGFDNGLSGWTGDGITTGSNEFRGNYAVLPAGATLTSQAFSVGMSDRFRLSGIARGTTAEASLKTVVFVEGEEGTPLHEHTSAQQRTSLGAPAFGEWTDAVPTGLSHDVLCPQGRDSVRVRFRFEAVGGEVWLDDIAFRPMDLEFQVTVVDAAPYNDNLRFPHYGEEPSLLADFNPTFDSNLEQWTFDPLPPDEDWITARWKERLDKEKKRCVDIPAGTTLLSSRFGRPGDPMGHKYSFRYRGWGKGGESGLTAEVLAFQENVEEPRVLGTIEWEAGSGWRVEELLLEPPPEDALTFQIRYRATSGSGFARVDDMLFMPVKTAPAEGMEYIYRVAALGADGQILADVESGPISGDWEAIGSYKSGHGLYNWMFAYMLVPMESTMFALLAFFIASAAFRSFRARSLEATLLLVAAIFVMIGRVPIGEQLWRPLGDLADWIMDYPNLASKRAIMIGVGLGMCATSLKLMLGIERTYLGKG